MEWKPILSLQGLYEAGSDGRIRSVARPGNKGRRIYGGKILAAHETNGGYLKVTPSVGGVVVSRKVARLVCEAFHGPPPTDRHHAAHKDGNRKNNIPVNLRWASGAENEADKIAHGTSLRGERANAAKLSSEDVVKIRAYLASGLTQEQTAKIFGVSQSTIGRINLRQTWGHLP